MAFKRTQNDPAASRGAGFPLCLLLVALGTFAAATGVDQAQPPLFMESVRQSGPGGDTGQALTLAQAEILAQTPGDRTTGTYTYTLTKLDAAGNSLGTVATLTVVAAHTRTVVDLRDGSGKGIPIKPGESIRLDLTGSAPTGGATTAANIKIRLWGEAYGLPC